MTSTHTHTKASLLTVLALAVASAAAMAPTVDEPNTGGTTPNEGPRLDPANAGDWETVEFSDDFTADWAVDSIGGDFTYWTNPGPIDENVENLRDPTINDVGTEHSIPLLQAAQRAWIEGVLDIRLPAAPEHSIMLLLQVGDGWFPSLDRTGGADGTSEVRGWVPREGVAEHITMNWTSETEGCPNSDASMDTGLVGEAEWFSGGHGSDGTADPVQNQENRYRSDVAGIGFAWAQEDSSRLECDFHVQASYRLQFLHEWDGGVPGKAEDIGYQGATASVTLCRVFAVQEGAEDEGLRDVHCGDKAPSSEHLDVLYAPVFPLGYAIKTGCDTVVCLQQFVDATPLGSDANLRALVDGAGTMRLFAYDVSSTGFAEGPLFQVSSGGGDLAQGTKHQMVISPA